MLKANSITTLKSGHFFQTDIMRLEKGRSEKPAVVAQGAVMISAITACSSQRLMQLAAFCTYQNGIAPKYHFFLVF